MPVLAPERPLPSAPRGAGAPPNGVLKAVLGPTNTGKTHLAIERLCAHASGVIGFPLRLLAREVYAKVCAIKGVANVALITGEERIEPPGARWRLCTAEAMPSDIDAAFVALDEAQLAAHPERGHIFTDRLLHARGRDETMLLGSAALAPVLRRLCPTAEITARPRFSTLIHAGAAKLSRVPPRSAIVAFSAQQVYAVAEALRRHRGGAAVVLGALSPATRNAQVALFESGEVDYIVATDAIGMGLNLDVAHVAFAGLTKFDGHRQRRLTPAEMAQIAGRAGRHHRDGSFGTLASGGQPVAFTEEEVFAIEEHRFAALTQLFWREAAPRFASIEALIADLEAPPDQPELAAAPPAIDLAVLRRLADEAKIRASLAGPAQVERFWEVCSLPDFQSLGVEHHARLVARLWADLAHGPLPAGHIAQAIARLDVTTGDIDALQARIAAVRSWAYIAERPDWIAARGEMIGRARAAEARLSDALHARLTERFVNRRTRLLLGPARQGPGAMRLEGDSLRVGDEAIGELRGFALAIDPAARLADRRLLAATAERHLPALLAGRASALAAALAGPGADHGVSLAAGALWWRGQMLARLGGNDVLTPRLFPEAALRALPAAAREALLAALAAWLARELAPLAALRRLAALAREASAGAELRAVAIRLVEAGGIRPRHGAGLEALDAAQRRRLGRLVRIGALDMFIPAMLNPRHLALWANLAATGPARPIQRPMSPVLPAIKGATPLGYRRAGRQWVRLDIAEDLLAAAHRRRKAAGGARFLVDAAPALAFGVAVASHAALLGQAGFTGRMTLPLPAGAAGPPRQRLWRWRPPTPAPRDPPRPAGGPFAALARLAMGLG